MLRKHNRECFKSNEKNPCSDHFKSDLHHQKTAMSIPIKILKQKGRSNFKGFNYNLPLILNLFS